MPRITSWVTRIATKSFAVRQEVVLRADAVMVLFDFDTNASRPFPDAERAYWSRYLEP